MFQIIKEWLTMTITVSARKMLQCFRILEITLPRQQDSVAFESVECCLSNIAPKWVRNMKTGKVLEPFVL